VALPSKIGFLGNEQKKKGDEQVWKKTINTISECTE